jgi:hypothetical protein
MQFRIICVLWIRSSAVTACLWVPPLLCNHPFCSVDATLAKTPFGDRELDLECSRFVVLTLFVETVHMNAGLGVIRIDGNEQDAGNQLPLGISLRHR